MPSSGNLPNLGIEPASLMSPALAGRYIKGIYIFLFRFFSMIGYYKILNIAPCAIH